MPKEEDKQEKQKSYAYGSSAKCEKCGSQNTSILQIDDNGYLIHVVWCEDCAREYFGERMFDNEGYG